MSSSQFAQASAAPVRVAPPMATKQPSFAFCAVCQTAGAGRDGPGRRRDDEHEYGDDQAVGQQRADDGAEVASAADGAEVWADVIRTEMKFSHALRCADGRGRRFERNAACRCGQIAAWTA